MKTIRRTFGSFFTRIGAGFLAFWLAVMAMFTVLVSQQRAELMLSDMESKSNRLMGEDTDILLDPSTYDATDETELRRRLSKAVFMAVGNAGARKRLRDHGMHIVFYGRNRYAQGLQRLEDFLRVFHADIIARIPAGHQA